METCVCTIRCKYGFVQVCMCYLPPCAVAMAARKIASLLSLETDVCFCKIKTVIKKGGAQW